jgi:hypothetical protein
VRQRSADDVETIHENIQRLKRERAQAIGHAPDCVYVTHPGLNACDCQSPKPPCDTEQDTQDYACGLRRQWLAMVDHYIQKNTDTYTRTPGEHTDGA